MEFSTRLVKSDEIDLLVSILEKNPFSNGVELSKSEILDWCLKTCEKISEGSRHAIVVTDENANPIAFTSGVAIPTIAGWIQGLTVMGDWGRPALTAEVFAAGMDELTRFYENMEYYKFWDISIKGIHSTGRRWISRHTRVLNRYDSYDERIIPKGELSGVLLWDKFRRINPHQPVISKLYVLKQEYRLKLIEANS